MTATPTRPSATPWTSRPNARRRSPNDRAGGRGEAAGAAGGVMRRRSGREGWAAGSGRGARARPPDRTAGGERAGHAARRRSNVSAMRMPGATSRGAHRIGGPGGPRGNPTGEPDGGGAVPTAVRTHYHNQAITATVGEGRPGPFIPSKMDAKQA